MKKIVSIIVAVVIAAGVVGGVIYYSVKKSQRKAPDTAETIEISYWKSGMGVEWLNNAIEKFEAEYPQYKVYLQLSTSQTIFETTIDLPDSNTVDLFFTAINKRESDAYLEDLSESVYNYKWEGESKTIGEKINPTVKSSLFDGGKSYYAAYGGGLLSLLYNADIIDGTNYEIPYTTNELVDLVSRLKDDNYTPFITFKNGGYWDYVWTVWMIQYMGLDYYQNTFLKLGETGTETALQEAKAKLKDDAKDTGRYQLLCLLEDLLDNNNVDATSANGEFTSQQLKFSEGQAAMMPNGTWFFNEMKSALEKTNFGMMKMPVLSDIVDKCEKIKTDSALSALVRKIDEYDDAGRPASEIPLTTAEYDATAEDVAKIYEARHLINTVLDSHLMMIPNYAKGKQGAIEFVRFLHRDDMIHEYADVVHLPFVAEPTDQAIDTTSWTKFEKQVFNIQNSAKMVCKFQKKSKLMENVPIFADISIYTAFASENEKDRLTADEAWQTMRETYDSKWNRYLHDAGFRD